MGPREKRIAEAVARGQLPKLPPQIENAPQLLPGLELYWQAYADLSTCRPPAFSGMSSIPWTAVVEYARTHGFDEDQLADLVFFCRRMDGKLNEVAERGNKQKPGRVQSPNPTSQARGVGKRRG